MKRYFLLLPLLALLATIPACQHATLETGGAYAPLPVTNAITGAVVQTMPDFQFFAVDSAFAFAYSAIDTAFNFERDNRAFLWGLDKSIKRTLDKIRPQAVQVRNDYVTARAGYMANPTPAGLNVLQTILGRAQQLSDAAKAVLPSLTAGPAAVTNSAGVLLQRPVKLVPNPAPRLTP